MVLMAEELDVVKVDQQEYLFGLCLVAYWQRMFRFQTQGSTVKVFVLINTSSLI